MPWSRPRGVLRQAVARRQARPAVGAAEEFVRQADASSRAALASCGQAGRCRRRRAWPAHSRWKSRAARATPRPSARSCARIASSEVGCGFLRISWSMVPRYSGYTSIAPERSAASTMAVLPRPWRCSAGPTRRRRLGQDLAEDVRLGEALGADVQGVVGGRGRSWGRTSHAQQASKTDSRANLGMGLQRRSGRAASIPHPRGRFSPASPGPGRG